VLALILMLLGGLPRMRPYFVGPSGGAYGGPYGGVVCYDKPGGGTYTCQEGEGCCGGSCYNLVMGACCSDKPGGGKYVCTAPSLGCCAGTCYKTYEEQCCSDGVYPDNKYVCWNDQGCCKGCLDKDEEQCCYDIHGFTAGRCAKDETCCGEMCADATEKCCTDGPGEEDPSLALYLCKTSEDCCGGDCVDTATKKCCGDGPYGHKNYGCLKSDCCNRGGCAGAGSICQGGGGQACSYCSGGGCTSLTCNSCETCRVKNGVVQCVGCLSNCEYCCMSCIDPDTMQVGVCVNTCAPPTNPCSTCEITPASPNGVCVSTCRACEYCYTQYNSCEDNCGGTDSSCYCKADGSCASCASFGYVCEQLGGSRTCKPPFIIV